MLKMMGTEGVGYEMNSFENAIVGSLKDFLMNRMRNKEYKSTATRNLIKDLEFSLRSS